MPTLHRVQFAGGAFVLVQLRDLPLPVRVTAGLALNLGTVIAWREPATSDRWRMAPLLGRRGQAITPNLEPAGVTAAEAAPLVAPTLSDDVRERCSICRGPSGRG